MFLYIYMYTQSTESLAKIVASPASACLHIKQITVVIFYGETGEGEIYGSRSEQRQGAAGFTGVEGSKM